MKVSSVISVIATLLAVPSLLVSQARVSSASASSPSGVEAVLASLAGTWQFDLYSPGGTAPVASGQREMRLLRDSTKLAWTETFAGQADVGSGLLGYNSATGAYYILGAYTHKPDPLVLIGRADSSGHTLRFDPLDVTSRPGTLVSSEIRLVDAEHFEWAASDGSWRAVFTRIGHS
jgi:hypothetical protein